MSCIFPEEHILQLEISGKQTVNFVCTNENLKELVIGYLLNQGLIRLLEDLKELRISSGGETAFAVINESDSTIQIPSSEVGTQTKEALKWMPVDHVYHIAEIQDSAEAMNKYTSKYKETGGVHCSALFLDRKILSVFEDLGRHNTIDKITGDLMLRKVEVKDALLVTTGRISSDMVLKANKIGVSVIVSYSTPTSLAKELAEKANMTLISYFGRDKRAVCSADSRVVL